MRLSKKVLTQKMKGCFFFPRRTKFPLILIATLPSYIENGRALISSESF